jgi:uncharacterized protein
MLEFLRQPWPWFVSGPLIGLMVPLLLLAGNKAFGISSSLRHICAVCFPAKIEYFQYDWKKETWNILFVVGIVLGGSLAQVLSEGTSVDIAPATRQQLSELGIVDFEHYMPLGLFDWNALLNLRGLLLMVLGGFLVGFGTRYANGCTSGHSITGLSNLQWTSLIATISFFVGGLVMTHFIYPLIF